MKLTLSFVSLAAVAAAAPFKAAVWSKVNGGDGIPHYRVGLAGAGPAKNYNTPVDIRSVDEREAQVIDVPFAIPAPPAMPAVEDVGFTSPPFVPEDMILPAIEPMVGPVSHDGPIDTSKPCHGVSGKSVELSNWLRKVVGMPIIAIEPVHVRPDVKVLHVEFKPMPVHHAHIIAQPLPVKKPHTHHHSKENKHSHSKSHSKSKVKAAHKRPFADRLTHALMSLGRWEGRFVAFVLGCGIGVLLRLVWVMGVLSYRSLCNRRSDDDDDEHETILTEEEVYLLPPPEYTDEKVALAAEEQRST